MLQCIQKMYEVQVSKYTSVKSLKGKMQIWLSRIYVYTHIRVYPHITNATGCKILHVLLVRAAPSANKLGKHMAYLSKVHMYVHMYIDFCIKRRSACHKMAKWEFVLRQEIVLLPFLNFFFSFACDTRQCLTGCGRRIASDTMDVWLVRQH